MTSLILHSLGKENLGKIEKFFLLIKLFKKLQKFKLIKLNKWEFHFSVLSKIFNLLNKKLSNKKIH